MYSQEKIKRASEHLKNQYIQYQKRIEELQKDIEDIQLMIDQQQSVINQKLSEIEELQKHSDDNKDKIFKLNEALRKIITKQISQLTETLEELDRKEKRFSPY